MFVVITSKTYRYGFNGKELDTEGMSGGLSTYDYGFRIYNPAICKFLSVDPLTASYPWYTPYQFAGNKPIWAIDLDGLEEFIVTNFYDAVGALYKTEITITNDLNLSEGGQQSSIQIVHYNQSTYDANGNALVQYLGSVEGTRASSDGAPSTALPPELNSVLFINIASPDGAFVEVSSVGIQGGSGGEVVLASNFFRNPTALAAPPIQSGSCITPGGIATIDWTTGGTCRSSNGTPNVISAATAPNGVAAAAPNSNQVAYLATGIHGTPLSTSGNLATLPANLQAGFNLGPVNPIGTAGADFHTATNPSSECDLYRGSGEETFNPSGLGISFPVNSQANGCNYTPFVPTFTVTVQ